MKARELRIGNLIDRGDYICEVIKIEEDGVITKPLNYATERFVVQEVNPVALTEEWLIRLKFHKVDGLWNNGAGYSIHYDLEGKNIRIAFAGSDGTIFPIIAVNIKNVHQLQNLVYALTETEITI